MPEVVTGHSEQIREWVSCELDMDNIGGEMFATLGIVDDDELIGGAVYHDYRNHMVEMSLATISPKWCSKGVLKCLLHYPFETLGVVRLNAVVSKNNKKMRTLLTRVGFKQEGCARKAFDGKQDAVLYGMLKSECKWI